MSLLHEIRSGFANTSQGAMLALTDLPEDYPGWVFRDGDMFGVATEVSEKCVVTEHFSGASLRTVDREFGGKVHHLLRLESSRETLRNEFAVICAQLLDPGEGGLARDTLCANPLDWWGRWRELLGNAVNEQNAYSVIGEMLALEKLAYKGSKPDWTGPSSGSVDIEANGARFEVKSTISRYDTSVRISGQFQLAPVAEVPLFLVHQRFEPSEAGVSVQMMSERLKACGLGSTWIEIRLTQCGLEVGCAAREEKYRLIESRLYRVDNVFPRISPASFVHGVIPEGVVRIEYTVDLAGLPSEAF